MKDWVKAIMGGEPLVYYHTKMVDERGRTVTLEGTEGVSPRDNEPNYGGISRWDPSELINATARVIVSRDTATCYLTVDDGFGAFHASGGAKRNKGETFDFQVGADLAVGRALINAGRELERRAMAKVAENERKYQSSPHHGDTGPVCDICGYDESENTAHWMHWRTMDEKKQIAAQLTDLPKPTREELEADIARANQWAEIADGHPDDPDAPQNTPLDDPDKRLSLYDRVKEIWR